LPAASGLLGERGLTGMTGSGSYPSYVAGSGKQSAWLCIQLFLLLFIRRMIGGWVAT
jgi:hypothetical protein